MTYESRDWSIELPDGWESEAQECCTDFFHPEGVGALQVSSYTKAVPLVDADLIQASKSDSFEKVVVGDLVGYRHAYIEDDRHWTKYWLRRGTQLLFVTYNCDEGLEMVEAEEVDSMINTLRSRLQDLTEPG